MPRDKHKFKLFTKDKNFYRTLLSLALPMAAGNLVTFLITLSDSIMIGRLGEEATASVYIGGLMATILTMLITGIEGGITVGASQYWGKGEKEPIRRIISIGTASLVAVGVILMLICRIFPGVIASMFLSGESAVGAEEYLKLLSLSFPPLALSGALTSAMRSIESPKISTVASLIALVINLIFNYLLIFGKLGFANLGIKGAAIATIIARFAELLMLLIYTLFLDKKLKLRPISFIKFNKEISFDFIKYTTPIVLGQVIWIVNTLFSSYLISSLGNDSVVAALAVANTLNALSYILMNGLSAAVGIIIGKTVGENKLEKIREYSYTTEIIFLLLGAVTCIALLLAKAPFISLYNISKDAADIAGELILVLSFTIIGTAYQSACLMGLVRGGGDVSFILKNDAFFIFLVVIPLSVCAKKLGAPIWLIFLALKSDQILKCLPAAIKINRFGWVKHLTE